MAPVPPSDCTRIHSAAPGQRCSRGRPAGCGLGSCVAMVHKDRRTPGPHVRPRRPASDRPPGRLDAGQIIFAGGRQQQARRRACGSRSRPRRRGSTPEIRQWEITRQSLVHGAPRPPPGLGAPRDVRLVGDDHQAGSPPLASAPTPRRTPGRSLRARQISRRVGLTVAHNRVVDARRRDPEKPRDGCVTSAPTPTWSGAVFDRDATPAGARPPPETPRCAE